MKSVNLRSVLILIIFILSILPLGCGGGSSSTPAPTPTFPPPSTTPNVQTIVVNGGPASAINFYPDAAFTSVTICYPGTSTCQTIDGVLVDTGSSGLRLLSTAVTLSLPPQTSGSNSIYECIQWGDLTYSWGPVATADVQIAGESATSVPIHLLTSGLTNLPTDCSLGETGGEADALDTLYANGILGIGPSQYDCGQYCDPTLDGGLPAIPAYYACTSSTSGCSAASVLEALQVQNPVALFSTDYNGVVIEFPAVSGPELTLSGSLIFGIGTQSNNGLGNATVLTLFPYASTDYEITANFGSPPNYGSPRTAYPGSWIDSGSNGNYFLDTRITSINSTCTTKTGFYCPTNPLNLTATNTGYNGSTSPVFDFSVGNADEMPGDYVLPALAGPDSGAFYWGLPFFYGRNVYVAIEGKPAGVYTGPYFAY